MGRGWTVEMVMKGRKSGNGIEMKTFSIKYEKGSWALRRGIASACKHKEGVLTTAPLSISPSLEKCQVDVILHVFQ